MEEIAIELYGDGGELGDFKIFANNVAKGLASKYSKVVLEYVNRDTQFFDLLRGIDVTKEKIGEMHIFAHSIGAGLFLGYKDPAIAARRQAVYVSAFDANRKVTYKQAVAVEVGAIQIDDFRVGSILAMKNDLRKIFSSKSFIKIWGV